MKTALILPGGGSMGAAEVGACRAILKKVKPDLIIGTSAGALNAACIANGKDIADNLNKLEMIWKNATKGKWFPMNPGLFVKLHMAKSIYSHRGIYNQLKKNISVRTFEELDIPVHVNCTNMIDGSTKFFSKGDLFDPVVASCAVPPFFAPVYIDDVPYIDGSISSYFGVKDAAKICKQIIVVNVRSYQEYHKEKQNLSEYSEHAQSLITNQLIRDEIEIAKKLGARLIEIKVLVKNVHLTDFGHTEEFFKIGEDAAKEVLDEIR